MNIKTSRARTPKAALYGLFALLAYCVLASALTTQWLAGELGHQSALGGRWLGPLYPPHGWIQWMWRYYRSAPELFGLAQMGFTVAVGVGALAYVLIVGLAVRAIKRHDGIHGTAHWATEKEIRASGLLPDRGRPSAGVYCGGWRDRQGRLHYLRHDGPEHVAGIAPTRSGKGVGLVVPTLLSWPHSVVVNDQKGELWQMTSGWRRKHAGNLVLKFDPAAESGSVAFNPLEEIRVGTIHEVGDVQNLVTIIVDPEGKGMSDHWSKTAHAFLTGVVLHLQYEAQAAGKVASLATVAAALANPAAPVDRLYQAMLDNTHLDGKPHPTVAAAARDMLNRAANEQSGVLSTAMSFLSLYRDPLIAKNVSRSDFKISDLMNFEEVETRADPATGEVTEVRTPRPLTLYLVVRAEDKDRMRPLMRLILNQIVRVLLRPELKYVDGQAQKPHLQRLLMMLDEFPSYGRLEVFQEALAYIAGYGIKAYLIMQDISQLHAAYGKDESIISNCHVRIAYAPNKIETGRWLSDNSGVTTVVTEKLSTSGARFGAVLQNVSRSYSETSRPLITADEAMRLKGPTKDGADKITDPGDVLVFTAGHSPIKGVQSLYFLDPVFRERVRIGAPAKSDVTRAGPPAAEDPITGTPSPAAPSDESGAPSAEAAPVGVPGFTAKPRHTRTRRARVHAALAKRPADAPLQTDPTAPEFDFGADDDDEASDEAAA
jgi:type IV secretion system protein VirD4